MKIGITCDVNLLETDIINLQLASFVPKPLVDAVMAFNHVPVAFPIAKKEMAKDYVEMVDAIIIPGGPDVSPLLYGEEPHAKIGTTYPARDDFEYAIIDEARKAGKPVLGICRGAQLINIYYGGNVYQDLASQYEQEPLQHSQAARGFLPVHTVAIEENSFLSPIFGKEAKVNSRHHQGLKKIGKGLRVIAKAKDGIPEAIENQEEGVFAVQWHPENLWESMPEEKKLFAHFFEIVQEKINEE